MELSLGCEVVNWSIFFLPLFQLMPLLVQSLSCEEQSLKLSTLHTMYSLMFDAPEIITRHVTSLVPILLGLSKFQSSMVSLICVQSWFRLLACLIDSWTSLLENQNGISQMSWRYDNLASSCGNVIFAFFSYISCYFWAGSWSEIWKISSAASSIWIIKPTQDF